MYLWQRYINWWKPRYEILIKIFINSTIYQIYWKKNGVGKNRQIAQRWQARDCNDDVLKVTALCCSIIIYSFFCSQSIYLNLGRLYQEANVCKVSKSVKGGSGPAFRAEARENFWVMVLGTKGFPVLVYSSPLANIANFFALQVWEEIGSYSEWQYYFFGSNVSPISFTKVPNLWEAHKFEKNLPHGLDFC